MPRKGGKRSETITTVLSRASMDAHKVIGNAKKYDAEDAYLTTVAKDILARLAIVREEAR